MSSGTRTSGIPRSLVRRISVTLLFVYALSGCKTGRAPTIPIDAEILSLRQWDKAQKLIRTCMLRSGFQYYPERYSAVSKVEPYLGFPFSHQELAERRQLGYGIVLRQQESIRQATLGKNAIYRRGLSKENALEYDSLLYGNSSLSKESKVVCIQYLGAQISKPQYEAIRRSRSIFLRDPAVKLLNLDWQACIRRKGYSADVNVWDAASLADESIDVRGKASTLDDELAIALADADCVEPIIDKLNEHRTMAEHQAR